MAKLTKLNTVNDTFTVYRYDNGFMIEIGGKDTDHDWKTCKILCNTEEELIDIIKEANAKEVDN